MKYFHITDHNDDSEGHTDGSTHVSSLGGAGDDELVGRDEVERFGQLGGSVTVPSLHHHLVPGPALQAAQDQLPADGVRLVGPLGPDGSPEDAVEIHGLRVLLWRGPEDQSAVAVYRSDLEVPGDPGETLLAGVEAGDDGLAVLHGTDLGVLHRLAPAPVQTACRDSSSGAAVPVVRAVTPAFHHGLEVCETLRPADQKVEVDTEAADVQTAGRDVLLAAALSDVQNWWRPLHHSQTDGLAHRPQTVVGVTVESPTVAQSHLLDLHGQCEHGGVVLLAPGVQQDPLPVRGEALLHPDVSEHGEVGGRPAVHLAGEDGGVPQQHGPGLTSRHDGRSSGDRDLPAGDHRGPVAVVSVAGDVLHVPGDVVYVGHHVSRHVSPQRLAIEVESHVGRWRPHGDTEDRHGAALCHHVNGVDGRGLEQISNVSSVSASIQSSKLVWTATDGS